MSEETKPTACENSPISTYLDDFRDYAGTRVLVSTGISSLIGTSIGFIEGHPLPLSFYSFAIAGISTSGLFFSTNYLMRYVRQKDDYINYSVAGCFTGTSFGYFFGRTPKIALIAGLVSTGVGALYKIGGDLLYDTSRRAWINHRRHIIKTSKYRVLTRGPIPKVLSIDNSSTENAPKKESDK